MRFTLLLVALAMYPTRAHAAEAGGAIGGGFVFWGEARDGGGLYLGICPLMLELEVAWDNISLGFGGHFVWAGGDEFDIGFHPAIMFEGKSGNTEYALGIAGAIALEHDSGWRVGLGGGPTAHLSIGKTFIGLDLFLLGITGNDEPDWNPGWELGLYTGYKF